MNFSSPRKTGLHFDTLGLTPIIFRTPKEKTLSIGNPSSSSSVLPRFSLKTRRVSPSKREEYCAFHLSHQYSVKRLQVCIVDSHFDGRESSTSRQKSINNCCAHEYPRKFAPNPTANTPSVSGHDWIFLQRIRDTTVKFQVEIFRARDVTLRLGTLFSTSHRERTECRSRWFTSSVPFPCVQRSRLA